MGYSWFEVSVRDMMTLVHILERQQNLPNDVADGGFGHLAGDLDTIVECASFDKLHDDMTRDVIVGLLLE
jgi:hypothetical protein